MKKNFLYLVILSSIGCSAPKKVSVENQNSNLETIKNPLEGTWVLKNVLMGDAMDMPCGFVNMDKVKEMNLTFTDDKGNSSVIKKLFGQSSVNNFSGGYTVLSYDEKSKTGKIQFFTLISTKMAAVNLDFMECEKRYLSYLEKSVDFKIEDGKLQLSLTIPLTGNSSSPWGESYRNVLYFYRK